jgi:hypothetical protein
MLLLGNKAQQKRQRRLRQWRTRVRLCYKAAPVYEKQAKIQKFNHIPLPFSALSSSICFLIKIAKSQVSK